MKNRIRRLLSTPEGKVGAVCASVLVLVLLVGGVIGLASNGSSSSYAGYGDTTSSTSSSALSPSNADTCALQVIATLRNLVGENFQTENQVNGYNDPFVKYALTLLSTYSGTQIRSGTTAANQQVTGFAYTWCAQNNNPIRPNYPLDGTSP